MDYADIDQEKKEYSYFDLLIKLIWEIFVSKKTNKSLKSKMKLDFLKHQRKKILKNKILKHLEELYNITKIALNSFQ